jgi:antiphage defense system Thoeris ThsB-like protein
MAKHRVFISYHHANDQWAKDELQSWNEQEDLLVDLSVNSDDVDDTLSTEKIREVIRDDYLRDSTVTVVLVGTETWGRKHVDWETYSSMLDGSVNKKSGVLVVQLPSTNPKHITAAHEIEKKAIYPEYTSWTSINDRAEYDRRYPFLSNRLKDNLLKSEAKVSVTKWETIANNHEHLSMLIDAAYEDRSICNYDLSRPLRRQYA